MSTHIHIFYTVFFTIIDPLVCIGTAYGYVFQPEYMLAQFTPSPQVPLSLETQILTDISAGVFLFLAILFGYLLRARPKDLVVWRSVQLATLMIDIGMLGGIGRSLAVSRRLDVRVLSQEERVSIGFTTLIAAVRIAFCAGYGVRDGDAGKRKKAS